MSATDAIADKLVALGLGTKGTDIFVQFMPEGKNGLVVIESLPGAIMDREVKQRRTTTYQIVVRGKEYVATRALAKSVFDKLHLADERLDRYDFYYIRALNEPVPFQRSEGQNFEFLLHMEAAYIDEVALR